MESSASSEGNKVSLTPRACVRRCFPVPVHGVCFRTIRLALHFRFRDPSIPLTPTLTPPLHSTTCPCGLGAVGAVTDAEQEILSVASWSLLPPKQVYEHPS